MKKFFVLLAVLSLLVVPASFAADKVTKNVEKAIKGEGVDWAKADNVLTTNVGSLLIASLNAHYEITMGKGNGLGFNGSFGWFGIGGWSTMSLGAGAEYNWYFQNHAPNGWFAGPGAGLVFYNASYKDSVTNDSASSGALGFYLNGHGGYRWIWDGGFTLDLGLALQYTMLSITVDINGTSQTIPIGGVGPGLGVNLGYAW